MTSTNDISAVELKKLQKENRMKMVKGAIHFTVVCLVEMFIGAATKSVLSNVEGSKLSKLGAKAGGVLAGMYLGEMVSDHICGSIDETLNDIEEIKKQMEAEQE